jgi:6-phosphogluconolactonase
VLLDLGVLDFAGADLTTPPPSVPHLYAGGYAGVITHDAPDAGVTTTPAGTSPSFLAVDPARRRLYTVDEATSMVLAFSIAPATGALTKLNEVSSGGSGPAHLSVDATGAWVLVANYGDGKVAVLPVTGGGLGTATDIQTAGANAHQIIVDSGDQHAWVPCKGADYIALYDFDAAHGTLSANTTPHITLPSGSGPRHLALHPTQPFAYLINENNSTMTAFSVAATGVLTSMQTLSTLPAGFSGTNTGAEVQLHPSGTVLYGSNRGHDSIVRYAIGGDGKLTLLDDTPTGGMTPRHFSLDATQLVVANQDSSTITRFTLDAAGALTAAPPALSVSSVSYAGLVPLP